jgi:hypothetical protein
MSVSSISTANRPQATAVQAKHPVNKDGKDFASVLDSASKGQQPQASAAATAASAPATKDNA